MSMRNLFLKLRGTIRVFLAAHLLFTGFTALNAASSAGAISASQLRNNSLISLTGSWYFIPGLLQPEQVFRALENAANLETIALPSPTLFSHNLNTRSATAFIVVDDLAIGQRLGLMLKSLSYGAATRYYFLSEDETTHRPIAELGHISAKRDEVVAGFVNNKVVPIIATDEKMVLVIQIAFSPLTDMINSKIWDMPQIGSLDNVLKKSFQHHNEVHFILGCFVLMAVYSSALFYQHRQDVASLFIAAACLFAAFRFAATEAIFTDLIDDPWLSYTLNMAFLAFSPTAMAYFVFCFTNRLFRGALPSWMNKLANIIFVIGLLTFFAQPFISIYYTFPYFVPFQIFLLIAVVLAIFRNRRHEDANYALGGFTVALFGFVNDSLIVIRAYEGPFLSHWSLCVLMLSLCLITGKRFARTFQNSKKLNIELEKQKREVTHLNEHLEDLVEQKTRAIRSILANIKQGIFNVLPNLTLDRDYSKFLTSIFDENDLYKLPVTELLFKSNDLSHDDRDLINTTITTSFDSYLNFNMNKQHLPAELTVGAKILEFEWIPISPDNFQIESILVVIRDVTRYRQLQLEKQEHRLEMKIIEEILATDVEKSNQFFKLAWSYIDENRNLLSANTVLHPESLKVIFINYHTLKGISRGLGYSQISEKTHLAETSCSSLNEKTASLSVNELMEELEMVAEQVRLYQNLSHNKLGRSVKHSVEVDIVNVGRFLDRVGELPSQLQKDFAFIIKPFTKNFYKPMHRVLKDSFASVSRLAKDLKKREPSINIECSKSIFLNPGGVDLISKTFTHLVRNSMDHGIETAAERKNTGKDEAGTLSVEVCVDDMGLTILFYDDGRGLNLESIKKIGVGKQLIEEHLEDKNEIANLIFKQGFSTSTKVSEISGRGVGMDAVQSFLRDSRSEIKLVLLGDINAGHQAVQFELKIAKQHFVVRTT